MKNSNQLIIKNYIKKTLKLTPSVYRTRLKNELQNNIADAFYDVPVLTEEMLHSRFGTPEQFADGYLSGIDVDELQLQLAHSKRHKRFLFALLITLLLLLVPMTLWILNENDRHTGQYYAIEIIDHDKGTSHVETYYPNTQ